MAIGKFPLTIGGYSVPRVSRIQVYKFTRHETRTTSFAGTDRVDRSAIKYKVIANVAICTAAEMQSIVALSEQITQSATFPDGSSSVTKTMIVDIPRPGVPVLKFGDRSQGVYYKDLEIVMEEA